MNNVLMAKCGTGSGSAYQATLNLNDCEWGGDISNQHGVLRCQTKALTAKSLMPTTQATEGSQSLGASALKPEGETKPLIVPQGIVQPVTLAPIPPGGSSEASDEDSGKKKKKKKHDRGERG
jgi:hypothetical protein